MNTSPNAVPSGSTVAFGRITGAAIALIVVGVIVLILGIGFDWGGLGGGLAMGGGIGLLAVGAYFWGYANGLRRTRAAWLPARSAQEGHAG